MFPITLNLLLPDPVTNHNNYHQATVKTIYPNSIVVSEDGQKTFITTNNTIWLTPGDQISYYGEIESLQDDSFSRFILSTGANGYLDITDFTIINKTNRYRDRVYNKWKNKDTISSDYILALFYKTKTPQNSWIIDGSVMLGISFLIIISGFHISFILNLVLGAGNKLPVNQKIIFIIASLMMLYFLYFIYFPPTGVRAYLMINISRLGQLESKEALSLTGIFFLLINPYKIFSVGLILSFTITFMILELRLKTSGIKTEIIIACFAFMFSLPIVMNFSTQINLLAPLLTIYYAPFVTFLYLLLLPICFFPAVDLLINPFLDIISIFLRFGGNLYYGITPKILSPIKVWTIELLWFYQLKYFGKKYFLLFILFNFEFWFIFYNLNNEIFNWNQFAIFIETNCL